MAYLHPSMQGRKRLKTVNEERLARRREKDTCEPHAERLRKRRCDGILRGDGSTYHHQLCPERQLFARSYRCDASHVRTKGAMGLWHEQVSHSRACHQEFEEMPRSLKRLMLPLAHSLAWESHRELPDEVPEPPVPDEVLPAVAPEGEEIP